MRAFIQRPSNCLARGPLPPSCGDDCPRVENQSLNQLRPSSISSSVSGPYFSSMPSRYSRIARRRRSSSSCRRRLFVTKAETPFWPASRRTSRASSAGTDTESFLTAMAEYYHGRIGGLGALNVEVANALGVGLDELLAWRNGVAHEHVKGLVGFDGVLGVYPHQRTELRVHGGVEQLVGVHLAQALVALNVGLLAVQALQDAVAVFIGVGVLHLSPGGDLVQRREGDVEVLLIDELRHVAEEERQQQGADVRAVDVGIGHDDDLAVAQLFGFEVLAEVGADGRDQVLDLIRVEHLIEACLLDVEDLAAQRQDGLEAPVAALLGRAAGRVTLHDEDLAQVGVALGAVGQLAGQGRGIERALALDQLASFARSLSCAGGVDDLLDDASCVAWV